MGQLLARLHLELHPSVECIPLTIAFTFFFMEKKDDYKKFYEQCGAYCRSKLGDEQISVNECVDCMKEMAACTLNVLQLS